MVDATLILKVATIHEPLTSQILFQPFHSLQKVPFFDRWYQEGFIL